jgi:catechol 2,3-dioxygenase-like lactoylglutathione lyase family enzyme
MFAARYFAHANVNTTDLSRAVEFYGSVLGLKSLGPTVPDRDQDGGPFDLAGQGVSCYTGDIISLTLYGGSLETGVTRIYNYSSLDDYAGSRTTRQKIDDMLRYSDEILSKF